MQESPTIYATDVSPEPRVIGQAATAWKEWHSSHEYRRVMYEDDVVQMVRRFDGSGVSSMTAEEAMKAQAPLLKVLGNPIPPAIMGELGMRSAEFWSNRGLNKEYGEEVVYDIPIGLVIAGTLCAFASRGHMIERCEQASDGCALVARMRSSMFSNGGEVMVAIEEIDDLTHVQFAATAKGQVFDFGQTKRSVGDMAEDIANFVSLMP